MQKSILDNFIYKLIDERGYKDALPEIKDEMHKGLKEKLDEFIMTRVVATFSDNDVREFEKLLDEEKSPEELKQFSMQHIPDYDNFMTSTLLLFQDAYLS